MRFAIVLWFAACGGGSGGLDVGECRSTADCAGDLECAGANDPPPCGIPPFEECSTDTDCSGTVCHAFNDGCSPDGVGSRCGMTCIDELDCGSGFVCDVGRCVAQLCDAGFACKIDEVCDPARLSGSTVPERHHGCFTVPCELDTDCGELDFCVNQTCQGAAGTCAEPILVP